MRAVLAVACLYGCKSEACALVQVDAKHAMPRTETSAMKVGGPSPDSGSQGSGMRKIFVWDVCLCEQKYKADESTVHTQRSTTAILGTPWACQATYILDVCVFHAVKLVAGHGIKFSMSSLSRSFLQITLLIHSSRVPTLIILLQASQLAIRVHQSVAQTRGHELYREPRFRHRTDKPPHPLEIR